MPQRLVFRTTHNKMAQNRTKWSEIGQGIRVFGGSGSARVAGERTWRCRNNVDKAEGGAQKALAMKKTFPLEIPDRKPGTVMDAIKHEIRKYFKRERRKPCPEGVDFWDFDCKVGAEGADPEVTHPGDVEKAIAAAKDSGSKQVYVEIIAKPAVRTKKTS